MKIVLFTFLSSSWLLFVLLITILNVTTTVYGSKPKILLPAAGTTLLRDGQYLPLIGLGVGNLQYDKIISQIVEGMKYGTRLIDTAHASKNEHLVRQGIAEGLEAIDSSSSNNNNIQVHVVTKIWYTYLGYERTKIAVREILEELNHPNIRVHVLIHWPRCRDDISWMKCEEEEAALPISIRDAGPPPHLDKANAFKESWRALEDIYLGEEDNNDNNNNRKKLESIGVSNFDIGDFEALEKDGRRVMPHILQDNVWNYMYNPTLVTLCENHNIHFQTYNVMNGIFHDAQKSSPMAVRSLLSVSNKKYIRNSSNNSPGSLRGKNNDDDEDDDEKKKGVVVSPHQLILKFLIQKGISVIPRTSSIEHVKDNSNTTLSLLTNLTTDEVATITQCISVMLKQEDLEQPLATFHNNHTESLHIYWSNNESNNTEELLVKEDLKPGEEFHTRTYPGHTFVAYYDSSKTQKKVYTVEATYGQKEEFHLEL